MPDQPAPDSPVTAAIAPPRLTHFTLDSAHAHALLAPRSGTVTPAPDPAALPVRCINPHLLGSRAGARP